MSETADFTIEVRDKNFTRVGQIAPEFTDLKFVDVHNGVGAWELKLPAEHPLLPTLKTKGAGIIVTEHWIEASVHKYRVYSGRMRNAVLSQNAADPKGTWVITGVDDNVIAAATTVYPDPAAAPNAQTVAYWTQSDTAETVMKLAVYLNAGGGARTARIYPWLAVPVSAGRGSQVKCSSRFDNLGDLLSSLGTAGGLGWEFRQNGANITFDVYEPQDKTGSVRLDIRNGGVESNDLGFSAPSATEVLVLGQGEGAARTVLAVTSTAAAAEAVAWGIRWEKVKDQRNTNDAAELLQAGQEVLTEEGSTVNSLKVVPSDAPGQRLGRDWYRGDKITVVIDGQETTALVTQVAVSISAAGVIRQATVGDPVGFNFDAKIASKVKTLEQRVGQVERLIGGLPPRLSPTSAIIANADDLVENGTYWLSAGAGTPDGVSHFAVEVVALSNGSIYQEARRFAGGAYAVDHYVRNRASGVWSPWKALGLGTKSWVPTIIGSTNQVGNGSLSGSYSLSDGLVTGRVIWTLGSTSVIGADLQFTHCPLPYTGTTRSAGMARLSDTSSSIVHQAVVLTNSSAIYVRPMGATTAASGEIYSREYSMLATRPFTWAVGDSIVAEFTYPIN
ncbi:minor tail protein [Microbacterium phage Lynlen]|uniref:minor tail protein n=1 Tax=Microbacterium phage Lynlen TaxID=2725651 RepID=UPI00146361BF|nr:minor tail protein [Microbacterium phage Lynlen]YP_010753514.1 minor tail protein [Microbacterium phage Kenzers]QJD53427.1 minor tail protein [Microbacterium phage Lynlen]UVT31647.1 minor tail protein [Microbacterium phage Kenzers]